MPHQLLPIFSMMWWKFGQKTHTQPPPFIWGTDRPAFGKKNPSEQESRCLDLLLHHFHSTHSDVPVKFLMSNCPAEGKEKVQKHLEIYVQRYVLVGKQLKQLGEVMKKIHHDTHICRISYWMGLWFGFWLLHFSSFIVFAKKKEDKNGSYFSDCQTNRPFSCIFQPFPVCSGAVFAPPKPSQKWWGLWRNTHSMEKRRKALNRLTTSATHGVDPRGKVRESWIWLAASREG